MTDDLTAKDYLKVMRRMLDGMVEPAVKGLAQHGVIAIERHFDEVTLVYADGYRWTKTERELLYCASNNLIPRRPGALH